MKKIILFSFLLCVTTGAQMFAQVSPQQNLDYAINTAENIPQDVQTAKTAVYQLAKQIVFLHEPNVQLFHDQMFVQVNNVQNNADDINWFVSLAQSGSAIAFSTAEIYSLTEELVNENDLLIGLTGQIENALQNNDNDTALDLLPQVKEVLNDQKSTAETIIAQVEALKQIIRTYKVCLRTVDNQGNPVNGSDLQGFYAQNTATGQYLYPENQDGNCFENLSPGTYLFDSYNGYWSGTSSSTVTLSPSQEDENGIIVVDLVYWSE